MLAPPPNSRGPLKEGRCESTQFVTVTTWTTFRAAQFEKQETTMTSEPATILASEMRMMESKSTGRKYRITIGLPYAYAKPPDAAPPFDDVPAWPVIYLLDADLNLGIVTDVVRLMALCGSTTDALVVGIGYREGKDPIDAFQESHIRRGLDFTPAWIAPPWSQESKIRMEAQNKRPPSTGDSANFHKFLSEELMPRVENEYRADPARRILVGHSLGGTFATYALLEKPGLFNTFVIGSPALSYGDSFAFKLEEEYAKEHTKLPAKVYLYVGDLEEDANNTTLTDTLRFAAKVQSRKYDGLSLVKRVFVDQNHCEVVAPGLQAGLKFALNRQTRPRRTSK